MYDYKWQRQAFHSMATFEEPTKNKYENTSSLEGKRGRREEVLAESRPESSESREKRKTLAHLVDSGRARTTEEAEHYLASLNRLKERLILFARELTLKQIHEPNSFPRDGMALYRSGRAEESDTKIMAVKNINQLDPNVWYLDRKISSTYPSGGGAYTEYLTVKTRVGSIGIAFDMDGNAAKKLKEQLSEEDVELLRREYAFAHKDLARQLRLEADRVSGKEVPESGMDERILGALFEEQEA